MNWQSALESLVNIPSHSENHSGIKAVQEKVCEIIQHLKWDITPTFIWKKTDHTQALIVQFGHAENRKISWLSHADTVFSGHHKAFQLTSPQKAEGHGVIDDKGGIIVAIMALQHVIHTPTITHQFICMPTEELGSPGFQDLLKSIGEESDIILGFEPALDDGSLISSRRGNFWMDVEFFGKKAHSGRAFELGNNAAAALCEKLITLEKEYSRPPLTTVNIAKLETAQDATFNTVPDYAKGSIEFRTNDFQHYQKLKNHFLTETPLRSCKAKHHIKDDCPPFSPDLEKQKNLLAFYPLTVTARPSGGSSDCNYAFHSQAIMIDGLGPVGGKLHTDDEWIDLASLKERSDAVAVMINRYLSDNVMK